MRVGFSCKVGLWGFWDTLSGGGVVAAEEVGEVAQKLWADATAGHDL